MNRTAVVLLAAAAAAAPSVDIADRYGRTLRTVLNAEESVSKPVSLEEVSPWLVLATLAAEDRRFFTHPGVDLQAVARALWQNAKAGRTVSGGSTISEQLVRSLNPRPRTFGGKIAEAFSALALERRLDKRAILEGYLNSVSYGGRLEGVEAASRAYFGTPARDLSLGQAALLAGIPKSPRRYDPRRHPADAFGRQRRVLGRMQDWGWLDDDIRRLALAEKIRILEAGPGLRAAHFTEFVRRQSTASVVRTTLDWSCRSALRRPSESTWSGWPPTGSRTGPSWP